MVELKLATAEDFDFFFELKSEDFGIYWGGHEGKPDRDSLRKYFFDILEQQNQKMGKKIYIIYDNEKKIGHFNVYPNEDLSFETSMQLSQNDRGKGRAIKATKAGLNEAKRLGLKCATGHIREDNLGSLFTCVQCGYRIDYDDYKMVFIPSINKEVKMYRVFLKL